VQNRRMTPHDASPSAVEPCLALWMTAITARDRAEPPEGTTERIRGKFTVPSLRFAVVGDDARPDGFALTTPDGELQLLAVAPTAAGRGVGRALLVDAIAAARSAGLDALTLAVRTGNRRALDLYESVGMLPVGDPRPHPLGGEPMLTYRLSFA
jgi:ribosomal protein S18 acetylase RimI-like enzyme